MADDDCIATIADILPFRAERTPRATALQHLDGDGRLREATFAELHRDSEGFAGRLHEIGVRPRDRVAILLPNSPRWVTAYYGIMRLGAVAVPLEQGMLADDPDRLAFALEHAEVTAAVCRPQDADAVGELGDVPTAGPEERADDVPPPPDVEPSDVAQILYTSGTTGPKKGVVLTHRNIIFDVRKCRTRFGVREDDCLPALLPFHHAYPLTTTIVVPPFVGARMAVGDIRDRRARDLLSRCRPTVLIGVPRVFESMLEGIRRKAQRIARGRQLERALRLSAGVKKWTGLNAGRLIFRRLHREMFGGLQLRFGVTGGAHIAPRVLREFFALGIPLIQGWGMSELSPVAAVQEFDARRFYLTRFYERKAGSIGTPLDGTRISFVPAERAGIAGDPRHGGEVVVSGEHVMQGYLKDPERTQAQMVGDAVRSGDIGRRDGDDHLYIVGRTKHVIVLPSGKKVFPEEDLYDPLNGCDVLDEFAVRPITGPDGGEKIGIIIRPAPDAVRDAGTMGNLYDRIKREIDCALEGRPGYLRQYDFCLTEWRGREFAELEKNTMGNPSPLRNPFEPDRAYSRMKDSDEPVPWAEGN